MRGWRKLHGEELLYSSQNINRLTKSTRIRWAGHVAHMGQKQNSSRVSMGKPVGKTPLGRPRRRCEDKYYNGS
jgi:hypothetical protein